MSAPVLLALGERVPRVHPLAWVAPGAVLAGDVHLGEGASVWYGCVLRADGARVEVGAGSNVQDGCVAHADEHGPVLVGAGVTVGHRAVLHGCVVEDGCLVGMGAVVLTGARLGRGSLVAAGAVVREGTDVPPRSLVVGVPAAVRRQLTGEEAGRVAGGADAYRRLIEVHRAAREHDSGGPAPARGED